MEELKVGKNTGLLKIDEHPMDPRKEYDTLCTMVCDHGRYSLGDTTLEKLTGFEPRDFEFTEELKFYIEAKYDTAAFEWLGLLDHSGIHMYLGGGSHWTDTAGWDSGTVGFIFMTEAMALEAFGEDYEEYAQKELEAEVQIYDEYIRGECYGIVIIDEFGEEVESVWGFYGYEMAVREMRAMLEEMDRGGS